MQDGDGAQMSSLAAMSGVPDLAQTSPILE